MERTGRWILRLPNYSLENNYRQPSPFEQGEHFVVAESFKRHFWMNDRGFFRRHACSIQSLSPQVKSMRWKLELLLLFVTALPARSQVRVWEGVLEVPVYEEGTPDPNPPFDQFAVNRFSYPYTLRKEITGERHQHRLRAIYLENEYLKCSVLPDVGGHVYTCIDKVSGQPMFYANPSLKKANIGYRGAWAAFGVEFNFPVSHNWMSMSPVDFAYAAHED